MKEIPLAHGKGVALVDDEDYPAIAVHKWSLAHGYAHARINGCVIGMHRMIMQTPLDKQTDHINGNRLDNRRSNLRICNASENKQNMDAQSNNSTGFKGVDFHRAAGRYRAQIKAHGKRVFLGYFDNAEDAARAYDRAAKQHFGEFAKPNLPPGI